MKKILACWCVFFYSLTAFSCTSFSLGKKYHENIFGKSFDWGETHALLTVNKRNVSKRALSVNPLERPAEWVSQYGSVTFNQHGREFPLGGMNEAGLVVEIMLGLAEHPPASDPRPVVNEVQWIQYVLDNYGSVREMLRSIDEIRIQKLTTSVHYLVCDALRECATVEYIGGQLVTYSGEALIADVFANQTYSASKRSLASYQDFGGDKEAPENYALLSRFNRAAFLIEDFSSAEDQAEAYAFDLLDQVAMSGVWRIVYSAQGIQFRTSVDRRVREISFADLDFSCQSPVKIFDIHDGFEGDARSKWENFSNWKHRILVEKNRLMTRELKEMVVRYPRSHTECLE